MTRIQVYRTWSWTYFPLKLTSPASPRHLYSKRIKNPLGFTGEVQLTEEQSVTFKSEDKNPTKSYIHRERWNLRKINSIPLLISSLLFFQRTNSKKWVALLPCNRMAFQYMSIQELQNGVKERRRKQERERIE